MFFSGCGSGDDSLTADEVRQALKEVPYQVTVHDGREGENGRGEVLVGTAKNQDEIRLGFAIGVGGAVIPKTLMDRLGITGATSSDRGWSEAYGINPGLTGALETSVVVDFVSDVRNKVDKSRSQAAAAPVACLSTGAILASEPFFAPNRVLKGGRAPAFFWA